MSEWASPTVLADVEQVEDELARLAGRRWMCRGHPRAYGTLTPSIDRGWLRGLNRVEKLRRERQSIDLFRSSAQSFGPGEEAARADDIVALAVLRHFGVPTRLLDWSHSPHVAAYFAVCAEDDADGELWAFDHDQYGVMGKLQWGKWPQTTSDRSGNPDNFIARLTAFTTEEPPDWFVCVFYPAGFSRQSAQQGFYSLSARFGVDHAELLAGLLAEPKSYARYIVKARAKAKVREALRTRHGISRMALFPDSAGAAETARMMAFGPAD